MSRVGRTPITLPDGVKVDISGKMVTISGPHGKLDRQLPGEIKVVEENSFLVVTRPNDERANKALHGLTRSLVSNMVIGVSAGFTKELDIVGVGYRAILRNPSQIEMALGFSHPVFVDAPEGVTFEVPIPTRIKVIGIDKELVGQVAANIRKLRKPEPYKGKGVRYVGEHVARKSGKAAK